MKQKAKSETLVLLFAFAFYQVPTRRSASLTRSAHRHAVASLLVLDRVHKVTHHQEASPAWTNSVFVSCRVRNGSAVKAATFVFDFDKDVVAQKSVADTNAPTGVALIAVSNRVDKRLVQTVSQGE